MITKKYYKLIRVSHADEGYFYIKNVSNEVGEFSIGRVETGTLEYSLDGVTWTSYDLTNKPGVNVNPGSNIYLRGTNLRRNADSYSQSIVNFNKNFNVGGNVLSFANYATMSSVTVIQKNSNCLSKMFYNQTNLISAHDMNFGNVTTIGESGLRYFFYGCSSLTTVPNFSNIITFGKYSMSFCFSGCSSLTAIIDFSSVTSVGDNGMEYCFSDCSSLTTPHIFSSVTSVGNSGLQNCFTNCTSLTTGVDFSTVTSVDYSAFSNCYNGCRNISNVTTPNVQDLTQNYVLNSWLSNAGTQATGTKVVNVPTGATITTGSINGIPTGWTRVDY